MRPRDDESLGQAANRFVTHHVKLSYLGLAVVAIFIVFVFIPMSCKVTNRIDRGPSFDDVDIKRLRP
ncbi:MAG: hypothetical protein AAGK78_02335 [Planctomycetota bacterium]